MSNVLYCQSTQSVIQPHLLVQSGEANDIVGLDPDYLILQKVEVIPEYNPATQSATEQWTVNLESLEYRQSWTIEPIVFLPDWRGFLAPFLTPTEEGIYHSIISNLSTTETIDHWTNVKMGLTNPEIRSPEWLALSWNALKSMLAADGNPLSEETIAEAEALMAQYHLLP